MTHLDPGTYTINVNDQADIHNFDLFGPGVKESTGVDTTGTTTWTVTFTDGTYNYVCDAHPAIDERASSRSAPSTTTTTTTTPPPAAVKVKAKAKVTGRTVAVTATATRVASLDFGLWKGTKRVAHATGQGEGEDGEAEGAVSRPLRREDHREGRRQDRQGLGRRHGQVNVMNLVAGDAGNQVRLT